MISAGLLTTLRPACRRAIGAVPGNGFRAIHPFVIFHCHIAPYLPLRNKRHPPATLLARKQRSAWPPIPFCSSRMSRKIRENAFVSRSSGPGST